MVPTSAHVILDIAEMGLIVLVGIYEQFSNIDKPEEINKQSSYKLSLQMLTNAKPSSHVIPMQHAITQMDLTFARVILDIVGMGLTAPVGLEECDESSIKQERLGK